MRGEGHDVIEREAARLRGAVAYWTAVKQPGVSRLLPLVAPRSWAVPAADPDGPLVPLPERPAPERAVPDFPLAAYRALVG